LPRIRLNYKHYNAFLKKIENGIYKKRYPQDLVLFHCYSKMRMEIALHAFRCLKKYLPPKKMQENPFRCGLHSFLVHIKSAVDSFTEEINLLYEIDPKLKTSGWRMSIEKLQQTKNWKKLEHENSKLFTEISNTIDADWFRELKTLRDEEAIHGRISGKNWQVELGGSSPITTVGIRKVPDSITRCPNTPSETIPDLKTWCLDILKETNRFLERCYKLM